MRSCQGKLLLLPDLGSEYHMSGQLKLQHLQQNDSAPVSVIGDIEMTVN